MTHAHHDGLAIMACRDRTRMLVPLQVSSHGPHKHTHTHTLLSEGGMVIYKIIGTQNTMPRAGTRAAGPLARIHTKPWQGRPDGSSMRAVLAAACCCCSVLCGVIHHMVIGSTSAPRPGAPKNLTSPHTTSHTLTRTHMPPPSTNCIATLPDLSVARVCWPATRLGPPSRTGSYSAKV